MLVEKKYENNKWRMQTVLSCLAVLVQGFVSILARKYARPCIHLIPRPWSTPPVPMSPHCNLPTLPVALQVQVRWQVAHLHGLRKSPKTANSSVPLTEFAQTWVSGGPEVACAQAPHLRVKFFIHSCSQRQAHKREISILEVPSTSNCDDVAISNFTNFIGQLCGQWPKLDMTCTVSRRTTEQNQYQHQQHESFLNFSTNVPSQVVLTL